MRDRRLPDAGERVKTPFGPATVLQVFGSDAMVQIEGGLKLRVPLSRVELEGQHAGTARTLTPAPAVSEPSPPVAATPAAGAAPRAGTARALPAERHVVDALRFGVVPRAGIEELTIGFEGLERYVVGRLPNATSLRPTYTEVVGAFGAGKSHTMAVVRHVAAARKFLVANVEIDGKAVTLSDPDTLLMQLLKTLRLPDGDQPAPALELHRACALNLSDEASEDLLGTFDRAWSNLETIRTAERHEALEDFAEGLEAVVAGSNEVQPTELKRQIERHLYQKGIYTWGGAVHVAPKRLVGRKVVERGPDFSSCLLAYAKMAHRAGYAGLVVTFDELEVEWALLAKAQFDRLVELVVALARALGGEDGQGCPLAVFTASVPGGAGSVRTILDHLKEATGGARHELIGWTDAGLSQLTVRVCDLYERAYGDKTGDHSRVADVIRGQLASQDVHDARQVRSFIRALIAELDRMHGPPASGR